MYIKLVNNDMTCQLMCTNLIGVVDMNKRGLFQLKSTTCHDIQIFVHNYEHRAFFFNIMVTYTSKNVGFLYVFNTLLCLSFNFKMCRITQF